MVSSYIKNGLRLLRCLSSINLYRHGALEQPVSKWVRFGREEAGSASTQVNQRGTWQHPHKERKPAVNAVWQQEVAQCYTKTVSKSKLVQWTT